MSLQPSIRISKDPNRRGLGAGARTWLHLLLWLFLISVQGLVCSACGDINDLAEEGTPASPVQRILTEENHQEGWGLTGCLLCHQVFRIHQKTSDPNVDLEEIRKIVERLGQDSCMSCHGTNGT